MRQRSPSKEQHLTFSSTRHCPRERRKAASRSRLLSHHPRRSPPGLFSFPYRTCTRHHHRHCCRRRRRTRRRRRFCRHLLRFRHHRQAHHRHQACHRRRHRLPRRHRRRRRFRHRHHHPVPLRAPCRPLLPHRRPRSRQSHLSRHRSPPCRRRRPAGRRRRRRLLT